MTLPRVTLPRIVARDPQTPTGRHVAPAPQAQASPNGVHSVTPSFSRARARTLTRVQAMTALTEILSERPRLSPVPRRPLWPRDRAADHLRLPARADRGLPAASARSPGHHRLGTDQPGVRHVGGRRATQGTLRPRVHSPPVGVRRSQNHAPHRAGDGPAARRVVSPSPNRRSPRRPAPPTRSCVHPSPLRRVAMEGVDYVLPHP